MAERTATNSSISTSSLIGARYIQAVRDVLQAGLTTYEDSMWKTDLRYRAVVTDLTKVGAAPQRLVASRLLPELEHNAKLLVAAAQHQSIGGGRFTFHPHWIRLPECAFCGSFRATPGGQLMLDNDQNSSSAIIWRCCLQKGRPYAALIRRGRDSHSSDGRLWGQVAIPGSMWRHLRISAEPRALFGDEFDRWVVELGVGFGGLSDVISTVGDLVRNTNTPRPSPRLRRRYTLVDLPPVEELASRYLTELRQEKPDPPLVEMFNSAPQSWSCSSDSATTDTAGGGLGEHQHPPPSLFISNYAFSELTGAAQEDYFGRVIRCAERGYIVINALQASSIDLKRRLANAGKQAQMFAEVPTTAGCAKDQMGRPLTGVIVWGGTASNVGLYEKRLLDLARSLHLGTC